MMSECIMSWFYFVSSFPFFSGWNWSCSICSIQHYRWDWIWFTSYPYYAYIQCIQLLVNGLLSKGINVQQNLPRIIQQIDENIVLPNKVSNLTRKIRKYLEVGGDGNDTVKEICQGPCHDLPDIFVKYGITTEDLISKTLSPHDHPISLTNSDVLYLSRLLHYKKLPWTHAEYWINVLVCGTISHFETPATKEIRQQRNGLHE